MDALIIAEPEPTGAEWFTVEQFADRYGMSRPGAASKLTRLYHEGKLNYWKGINKETRRQKCKYSLK